jgi:hypothetical protein
MDKANIVPHLDYRRVIRDMDAGVNVYQMSFLPQFAGKFPDIDTHAAGIFCPEVAQRAAMDTEYADFEGFLEQRAFASCIAVR